MVTITLERLQRPDSLEVKINNRESFRSYVAENLDDNWELDNEIEFPSNGIVILPAIHNDQDVNPVVDCYQFHVWIKGRGIATTETFQTDLDHPPTRHHCVGVSFSVGIIEIETRFITIKAVVSNRAQRWKRDHFFQVQFKKISQ